MKMKRRASCPYHSISPVECPLSQAVFLPLFHGTRFDVCRPAYSNLFNKYSAVSLRMCFTALSGIAHRVMCFTFVWAKNVLGFCCVWWCSHFQVIFSTVTDTPCMFMVADSFCITCTGLASDKALSIMRRTEQTLCLSFILNFFAASFFRALSVVDFGQLTRESYSRTLQAASSSVRYATSWTT